MKEFIEYVCVGLHVCEDMEELESHLFMNGYNFGIDKSRYLLFVDADEIDYVETVLKDRNIIYAAREC